MTKKTITFAFAVAIMLCQYVFASDTVSENEVKAAIVKNSIEIGVEPALALSIAKSESKFRHNVRSPYGAVGVFQEVDGLLETDGVKIFPEGGAVSLHDAA